MTALDGDILRQIAPKVGGGKAMQQTKIIQEIGDVLASTVARFDIDNDLRRAHFLAQVCHESDGFCTTVEYASGQAYEGRADLGNDELGDGPRYKGRGLIQMTGRANYLRYGRLLGLDLIGKPELAAEPATSLVIACQFWSLNGLNVFADQDNIETITRRINGGLNGLAERRACLARAKSALAGKAIAASPGGQRPTLRLGDAGEQVAALQSMLSAKGFALDADGNFGSITDDVVKQFQASRGLPADGVVGPRTWQMLAQV